MDAHADASGLVTVPSRRSVDDTLARLLGLLKMRGLTVFAVIDHSGEAAKVGMSMPATKLVLFGSPKAGTPLMLTTPSIAIDLPLKLLIREGSDGTTLLSYNSAEYLSARHSLPAELQAVLAGVASLVNTLTE